MSVLPGGRGTGWKVRGGHGGAQGAGTRWVAPPGPRPAGAAAPSPPSRWSSPLLAQRNSC